MRWVAKAMLQGAFSALPRGDELNYIFQRRVTRNLPRGPESFEWHVRQAADHWRRYCERADGPEPSEAVFYEFGAGWALIGP